MCAEEVTAKPTVRHCAGNLLCSIGEYCIFVCVVVIVSQLGVLRSAFKELLVGHIFRLAYIFQPSG